MELNPGEIFAAIQIVHPDSFDFNYDPEINGVICKIPGEYGWGYLGVTEEKEGLLIATRDKASWVEGSLVESLRQFKCSE